MAHPGRQIALWSSLVIAGAVLGGGAAGLVDLEALLALDERIAAGLQGHRRPAVHAFMLWVTWLHSHLAVSVFAAFLAIVMARRNEWRWVLTVIVVIPGGLGLNALLTHAFLGAHPDFDDPLMMLAPNSFPSGHTAAAALLYGVLAAYLASRLPGWGARLRCAASAVLLVALVGFSRMYLGVHYLSDVLAAASASAAWLVLCLTVAHARSPARHH